MKYSITYLLLLLWINTVFAQNPLYVEHVDTALPPALPTGWTAARWQTSSSNASPGSGQQNLLHSGTRYDRLCMPVMNTQGATLSTLSYLARRTSSYASLHLVVRASIDGGATFPYTLATAGTALPSAPSSWETISLPIPSALSNASAIQICFDAYGGSSSGSKIQLDDITIEGTGSISIPPVALSPTSINMGFVASDDKLTHPLHIRNQTDGTISIIASPPGSPWGLDATTATLNAGETTTWNVSFSPSSEADFTASLTITESGSQTWVVLLSGTSILPDNYIGFASTSTSGVEQTSVTIPLDLHLGDAPDGLQGLSLTLQVPSEGIQQMTIQPGNSINNADWQFTTQTSGTNIHLLLIGNGSTTLSEGSYAGLFTLTITPSSITQSTDLTFEITDISATAGNAQGTTLPLAAHIRSHILSVRPMQAFFQLSTSQLDVGTAEVGSSTTATFDISNPGGERTLEVSAITSSNAAFTVSPTAASIAPDASITFTVTFTPDLLNFGQVQATLSFTHDGDAVNGQQTLDVEAIGTGGLGDASGEGRVDIADFTRGVDIFLGRATPDAHEQLVLDIAPFPGGDGSINLEDLTVLIRAIASQTWPDGTSLPLPPPVTQSSSNKTATPMLYLSLSEQEEQTQLEITAERSYAALQLRLRVTDSLYQAPAQGYLANAQVQMGFFSPRQEFTLILYRLDGQRFPPATYSLGRIKHIQPQHLEVVEFVAVDEEGTYLPTQVIYPSATAAEEVNLPEERVFYPPYPQPFVPALHRKVTLAGTLAHSTTITLEVYDILGRKIIEQPETNIPAGPLRLQWDGRNLRGGSLPSGTYLIRIRGSHFQHTFTVVLSH